MSQEHSSRVKIVSTVKIKVASESTARINLTAWDLGLLFLEYSQKGLLFRKPSPHQETTTLIHHLKSSLQRTLHFFPPLAGRLTTTTSDDGAATTFFIDCSSNNVEGGALFVHAKVEDANFGVADILNSSTDYYVPEIVGFFFPLTGVRNHGGVTQPLMAVQVTELADGLFVGCSINHLLVDGTSFWHFFNSWAQISRGDNINPISKPPILNRDQINLDLSGSGTIYIHDKHLIHLGNNNNYNQAESRRRQVLKDRIFHLSKESVAKLKRRANEEMGEISKGKISSLQAIVAHVWRCIIRCRFAMDDCEETTTFEVPMGARQRMEPPLPEEYFGNAVFPGIVTLETSKLLENGLGWAAWQINRMVASGNGPGKVKERYTGWIKEPVFLQFEGLPRNFFILINSPRFDVYDGNDFGWGKPVAVRSGKASSSDGRITVTRGVEEGSVDIEACLAPKTLSAMADDSEFMESVN
ncbi:hypothetical protein ABFS83_04G027200 [Erythranthe nasuta]